MVEWDGVVLHNDYEWWVNIGEDKELVWLCRVGDDYGYDMVVDGKVG